MKGRKPLSDEERELRRIEKQQKQKEFYNQNKKYFMMKYNSYLLNDNITLDVVEKKLQTAKMNCDLLYEILETKKLRSKSD